MKKIGFFIGHENYIPHSRFLRDSIIRNARGEFEIYGIVAEHRKINLGISEMHQIKVEIDEKYREIPFLDKMIAASEFEKICDEAYVWLDVESCFLKPLIVPFQREIYINPVDKRNIGDLYGEERSKIWRIVRRYFGMEDEQDPVFTTISKERIFPYYNVGMVIVNNNKNLFCTVRKAFDDLLEYPEIIKAMKELYIYKIFFHHIVFSCAAIKLYGKEIGDLPLGFNYPLHLHSENKSDVNLKEMLTIRYDDYFDRNNVPEIWKDIFGDEAKKLKSYYYY